MTTKKLTPAKKPSARPLTQNRGAADERSAWMNKLRRMWKGPLHTATSVLDALMQFGDGRAERDNHRKGGLGRKWVAKPVKKGRKKAPEGQGKG